MFHQFDRSGDEDQALRALGLVRDDVEGLVVGRSLGEARSHAEARGLAIRVVRRDGRDLPATTDLCHGRVNVAVEGDLVTEVMWLG